MKILLISASPRAEKSATYTLAAEVLKGAQAAGAETETVQLAGKKIGFCHACEACHRGNMTCPLKDDAHHIILKMLNADGIVFATPNYINQVTAPLKALMDRTSNHIHCQRFLGKYTAAVVTSGSGHNDPVCEYLAAYGRLCGAQNTGAVSCGPVPAAEELKEARELGAKLAEDIKNKAAYADQLEEIKTRRRYFAEIVARRKEDWDGEYHYYREKGWLA